MATAKSNVITAATVEEKLAPVDPFVQSVLDAAEAVVEDPNVQLTLSKVTPKIPSRVRDIIYIVGITLGALTTAAAPIVAGLTGQAAVIGASVIGIALTLTNLLSKLNLSKTAEDIEAEADAA